MSDKRSKERWALFAGSMIGIGQAMLGMALTLRAGPAAAFIGSCLTYLAGTYLYLWATKPVEETKDENG